jgi:hypothetical protein
VGEKKELIVNARTRFAGFVAALSIAVTGIVIAAPADAAKRPKPPPAPVYTNCASVGNLSGVEASATIDRRGKVTQTSGTDKIVITDAGSNLVVAPQGTYGLNTVIYGGKQLVFDTVWGGNTYSWPKPSIKGKSQKVYFCGELPPPPSEQRLSVVFTCHALADNPDFDWEFVYTITPDTVATHNVDFEITNTTSGFSTQRTSVAEAGGGQYTLIEPAHTGDDVSLVLTIDGVQQPAFDWHETVSASSVCSASTPSTP